MKKILAVSTVLVLLSACKMDETMDATIAMGPRMDGMKNATIAEMDKTNESIRHQTMMVALTEMQKDSNQVYLFPPIGMMPYGETFGKSATAEELVKITYAWLKEINSSTADGVGPQADGKWPAKEVLDREKYAKLVALQVIAGMAPQAKVEKVIEEQIRDGGRFESAAYEFLMLRYAFIDGIMIQESLFSKPMINPGMFLKGLEYLKQLEFISKLSFKDSIAIKVIGTSNPEYNIEAKLEAGAVKARYMDMKNKLSQLLPKYTKNDSYAAVLEEIKSAINQGIAEN